MSDKQLLFSVTKKDLDVQFFCTGGPGGQKQNKTASGCRIVHVPSGAVGESRELRSQPQNKKLAFERLVRSAKFKSWVRAEAAARAKGFQDLDDQVDREMKNVRVEVSDDGVKWAEEKKA